MINALKTIWLVILWPFRYLQDVLFPTEEIVRGVVSRVFLKAGCEYRYSLWAKGSVEFCVLIVLYNKLARRYLQEDGTFGRRPIRRDVNSDTYKEIVISFTPRYTGHYDAGSGAPADTEKFVIDDETLKKIPPDESRMLFESQSFEGWAEDNTPDFEAWKSVE